MLFSTDIPFLMNLYYSVFDWNGISKDMKFVGLQNFVNIFSNDALFWKGRRIYSEVFSVLCSGVVNILSLTVALVMAEEKKSSGVGRAFYYIPYIISLTGHQSDLEIHSWPGFEALYQTTGWEVFHWSWLGSAKLAFFVVLIMTVWQNLGFYMVNYIAGIISVPRDLIEAAKIDGGQQISGSEKGNHSPDHACRFHLHASPP